MREQTVSTGVVSSGIKWRQVPIPMKVLNALKADGSEWVKRFEADNELVVLYSLDPTKQGPMRHFSISHPRRYPSWAEIMSFKNEFLGDMDAMMVLPKQSNYVNIHPNCFHVWETPAEWEVSR